MAMSESSSWPLSSRSSPELFSRWAASSPSPKGTSVDLQVHADRHRQGRRGQRRRTPRAVPVGRLDPLVRSRNGYGIDRSLLESPVRDPRRAGYAPWITGPSGIARRVDRRWSDRPAGGPAPAPLTSLVVTAPVMTGAEPFAAVGGHAGALVLHGFTGNPFSMRGVARRLAHEGLTVELPLLPGHGTAVADLVPTRFDDWSAAAEQAYLELAGRCDRVAVVGLSMGGTLACWLAARHPGDRRPGPGQPLATRPPARSCAPWPTRCSAQEKRRRRASARTSPTPTPPSVALRRHPDRRRPQSLFEALERLGPELALRPRARCSSCPAGTTTWSPRPTGTSWCHRSPGRWSWVWLERSYHVATLDYDRDEVEDRLAGFVVRA